MPGASHTAPIARAPAPRAPADLTGLPERFTLLVEQRPNGFWKVSAPDVHIGLFVAKQDLHEALAEAPGALAQIVRLDGVVTKAARGRKVK